MNALAQRVANGLFANVHRTLRGEIPMPDITILPITYHWAKAETVIIKGVRPERGIPLERKQREAFGIGKSLPSGDL